MGVFLGFFEGTFPGQSHQHLWTCVSVPFTQKSSEKSE